MKIFISVDMEGISDVTAWNETIIGKEGYEEARRQMTLETIAAIEGAKEAGATEIVVRDAHDTGLNIRHSDLPDDVILIRGWSKSPWSMVDGIDDTFSAAIFIGYHTCGGSFGNPLSHTMDSDKYNYIKLNGVNLTEFYLHGLALSKIGVPMVFLSGDAEVCKTVKKANKNIGVVAVKDGFGGKTTNIHPRKAERLIKEGVKKALTGDYKKAILDMPEKFVMELSFKNVKDAIRASFYENTTLIEPIVVEYKTSNIIHCMKAISFM